MRALVWRGPFSHQLEELDTPVAGPGEVLVEVARVGICGSDVTAHKGVMGISKPGAVRGHEFSGTVTDAAGSALAPGTRVSVDPVIPCGTCPACLDGRPSSCSAIRIVGVHRPGAFARYVAVPAGNAHPVPDSLSWEAAASAEPLAQARHDVLRAAELGPLGECLVIGSGSIGLWIVHALRLEGATGVTVVDPDAAKHDSARAAGAALCVSSADEVPAASFDTVFDVVGIAATRGAAISRARNGGTVIAVGLGADEVAVPWFDLVRREITVRGANCFTPADFEVALGWLADGTVAPAPGFRVVDLAEGGAVFDGIVDHTDAFSGKTFLAP
ncbi:zinc-dependent alcohol dehydrogenase [Herbiconiux daphne]|uniref:Alcohol dehydrogenase catalytic domain-containing protein n=1 Tax=Herbiconiux daphne TaxID=2970914 RepID=A0ABT2H4D2_9MICO|nr:alcohol dehydrogenase catalytic domain-containing protein [Herbiconiux daphne]MCS5734771.1 alcohol dehydrogenase catalytic domain-containing protein [Herbiconiux daphne]